jgi:hypothetical protein
MLSPDPESMNPDPKHCRRPPVFFIEFGDLSSFSREKGIVVCRKYSFKKKSPKDRGLEES